MDALGSCFPVVAVACGWAALGNSNATLAWTVSWTILDQSDNSNPLPWLPILTALVDLLEAGEAASEQLEIRVQRHSTSTALPGIAGGTCWKCPFRRRAVSGCTVAENGTPRGDPYTPLRRVRTPG